MSSNEDSPLEVRRRLPGPNPPPEAPPRPLPVIVPRIHVPARLRSVRGLHAIPETYVEDLVIYALCTDYEAAPGRVEGEVLYVGLTDDLDLRRWRHRTTWAAEGREPWTVCLWWAHPGRYATHRGVTAHEAEAAFIRYLRPRYNVVRGDDEGPLSELHRKALRLHGVVV